LRIGFLFNHAAAHQAAHAVPVAAALARLFPDVTLRLFVAEGPAEDEVRRLWQEAGQGADGRIVRLEPATTLASLLLKASGGAIPADRLSILRSNLHHFRDCDALVVPEKTSTLLKTRFGLDRLPLIHTRHGAGDRAIGFDRASGLFDLVLLSGPKIRDRLEQAGLTGPDRHAIVGYPKFDLPAHTPPEPLFATRRPTVLYNPHPSPALSSWYRMGPAILDWFAQQDRFNLIFAPHVMLFAKRWNLSLKPLSLAQVPQVPERLRGLAHVRIDPGSRASVDMTYSDAADIYLGDASSQVYEFLRRPRPCIFVDAHNQDWQGHPDFAHWQAGPVVRSVDAMAQALERALQQPDGYATVQQDLFRYSFDLTERPSAQRAAEAIMGWLAGRQTRQHG
jgi:hypothetical protein